MIVVCVDDHQVMLSCLSASAREGLPSAEIHSFTQYEQALSFIQDNGCDVLLCEIELYRGSGMLLAEQAQKRNPQLNIIFVTVCDEKEHAREVLQLKPSGYLTKPASKKQIVRELAQLRYPVAPRIATS